MSDPTQRSNGSGPAASPESKWMRGEEDRPIPLFDRPPTSNATSPSSPSAAGRYLCVWLDTSWDSPLSFNQRLGRNASCFHFAQKIPLAASWTPPEGQTLEDDLLPPLELIDQTSTDAILYLSVFPKRGLPVILDKDLQSLVQLVTDLNVRGRRVFLRFAPGKLMSFICQ